MSEALFGVVPESQRQRARSALAEVFGRTEPSALEPVSGGASGALRTRATARGWP